MLSAYDLAGLARIVFLALGMLGVTTLASRVRRAWCVVGVVYASVLIIAPVMLRSGLANGFIAIIFLFAIVWPTDIVAYFVGRAIGGPEARAAHQPRARPGPALSKDTIGRCLAEWGRSAQNFGGYRRPWNHWHSGACPCRSRLQQVGDLFESALKRRFEAKDAGSILPGHGGLMDRLDGFVAAALAAMLIGLVHGGMDDTPARGADGVVNDGCPKSQGSRKTAAGG